MDNDLTVTNAFEIQGATLSGAGTVNAMTSVSFDPSPAPTPSFQVYIECPFVNYGEASVNGVEIFLSTNGVIQNHWNFTMTGDASLNFVENSGAQFINSSSFISTSDLSVIQGGGPGALFADTPYGSITVNSGTLQFVAGGPTFEESGVFAVASNSVLQIDSGIILQNALFDQAHGAVILSGSNQPGNGGINLMGNLEIDGAFGVAAITNRANLAVSPQAGFNWLDNNIRNAKPGASAKRLSQSSAATNTASGPTPALVTLGAYIQTSGANLLVPIIASGTNEVECSQIQASGGITISGRLTVVLTGGYTPPKGTTLPCLNATGGGRLVGTFSTYALPPGWSVTYTTNQALLVFTDPAPVQILNPQLVGGQIQFSFNTAAGQSYTIQSKPVFIGPPQDAVAPAWTTYTNIIGTGAPWQFTAAPQYQQGYFRVSEP